MSSSARASALRATRAPTVPAAPAGMELVPRPTPGASLGGWLAALAQASTRGDTAAISAEGPAGRDALHQLLDAAALGPTR